MSLNLCNLCGHAHRGSILCAICGCSLEPLILQDEVKTIKEDNMVKKIVKWVRKIICWPFKKAHEWLTNSLPK